MKLIVKYAFSSRLIIPNCAARCCVGLFAIYKYTIIVLHLKIETNNPHALAS